MHDLAVARDARAGEDLVGEVELQVAVVVDLAAEAGGNCELTKPGEVVRTDGGVVVDGTLNLPSRMPEHASALYARNVSALLELMSGEDGALALSWDDEVIAGACITRGGEIVHDGARQAADAGAPSSASGSTQPRS